MSSRDDMVLTPSLKGAGEPSRGVAERRQRMLYGRPRVPTRGLGARGVAGLAARAFPPAAMAAIVIILAAAVLRIYTGKTFGQMQQFLNDSVLGDADEEAAAHLRASQAILSNPDLARGIFLEGGADHLVPLLQAKKQLRMQELQGLAIGRRRDEFARNSKGEIIILRGWNVITQAINTIEGF